MRRSALMAETDLNEIDTHSAAMAEVAWVMANTSGVVGLRMDGQVMPWAEVRKLYMPSWPQGVGETRA